MTSSPKPYGTHDIAKFCHVSPATVGRWIEDGRLPSFSTGGGHRRVWDKDLIPFLKEHGMPVPPELAASAGPFRILIVDDEKHLRDMVRMMLQKLYPSAEFHEAEDGFEAGQKISALIPRLVVLDLRLPGLDGLKVCESVKTDERLKATKIIAVTGFEIEKSRQQMLEAGADGFVPKPFRAATFTAEAARLIPPETSGSPSN